jgi:hypothetical protein
VSYIFSVIGTVVFQSVLFHLLIEIIVFQHARP